MRPYMYKAYQSSFNIEKYFIFLKTTHIKVGFKGVNISRTCFPDEVFITMYNIYSVRNSYPPVTKSAVTCQQLDLEAKPFGTISIYI